MLPILVAEFVPCTAKRIAVWNCWEYLKMRGGVKVYRGSPAAARDYVEAGRSRADDYYLAEGTGLAERLTVDRPGGAVELAALSGDRYEAWVAGLDPDSGEPRGRLRTDSRAVRFLEVVVNGPKSWSLAAALHPDIAVAHEAAQDAAARQILDWLGQHGTTRVGPRGRRRDTPRVSVTTMTLTPRQNHA